MAMSRANRRRLVVVDRSAGQNKREGAENEIGKCEPLTAQRVIEFPKPPAAKDVCSDRIIFQIGDDRIAIKWTAEIEELPPAGPIAVEPKRQAKLGRSPRLRR
jgi:hypothetical protein